MLLNQINGQLFSAIAAPFNNPFALMTYQLSHFQISITF